MKFNTFARVAGAVSIFVLAFMAVAPVSALSTGGFAPPSDIVIRSTTFWDATFFGNVDSVRTERWSLQLENPEDFVVTVTTTSGDLVPTIRLLDAGELEIAGAVGVSSPTILNTSQPAGDYYLQVEAESGSGTYIMTIRRPEIVPDNPNTTIQLDPAEIALGESTLVTVFLLNVPEGGYASAEFTCHYDPAFIEVSNIQESGLFGVDPAAVLNGPSGGTFIFAIAGSNGQRATSDGPAFTFEALALQVGETDIQCDVRVSTGESLQELASFPITLTITEPLGTVEGTVNSGKVVTVTLYDPLDVNAGSVDADGIGFFTIDVPADTYRVVATSPGYLRAEGEAIVTSGNTTTMPTIDLLAGDIDGNDVIDAFDALTIGINYNLATPTEADLNNDGIIDVLDLELLAANYNVAGPTPW